MKQRILDQKTQTKVSALGLGCMGMSEWYGPTNNIQSSNTIAAAFAMGVNFFDTADMYGKGSNEELVGKAIQPFRNEIIIATKCGIVRDAYGPNTIGLNCSAKYIKDACDASLKRLGVDYIDLYYLHRVDPKIAIEESMQAMADLVAAGKIRFVGLSEADETTIRKAQTIFPVTAVQTEFSIGIRKAAETVLPACRELGISFVCYSPISRGLFSGKYYQTNNFAADDWRRELPYFQQNNLKLNLDLITALESIAKNKNCTVTQLALAWLLAQDEHIIPIPGTRRLEHLEENLAAVEVELTVAELNAIEKICNENPFQGQRLPEALMQLFELQH